MGLVRKLDRVFKEFKIEKHQDSQKRRFHWGNDKEHYFLLLPETKSSSTKLIRLRTNGTVEMSEFSNVAGHINEKYSVDQIVEKLSDIDSILPPTEVKYSEMLSKIGIDVNATTEYFPAIQIIQDKIEKPKGEWCHIDTLEHIKKGFYLGKKINHGALRRSINSIKETWAIAVFYYNSEKEISIPMNQFNYEKGPILYYNDQDIISPADLAPKGENVTPGSIISITDKEFSILSHTAKKRVEEWEKDNNFLHHNYLLRSKIENCIRESI